MTEQKHTPGPWELDGRLVREPRLRRQERGHVIARIVDDAARDNWGLAHANARRIVECVNAMEGIEDPQTFVEEAQDFEDSLSYVTEHRDALMGEKLDREDAHRELVRVARSATIMMRLMLKARGIADQDAPEYVRLCSALEEVER